MKKVLFTFLVVIVVLVGGALAAPSFVDWNAYKDDLRLVVKEQTGRDLVIEGDIKARLIPSPEISAEDIRLSNSAGSASEDMLSLKAVRVKVAIAPEVGMRRLHRLQRQPGLPERAARMSRFRWPGLMSASTAPPFVTVR